MEQNAEKPKFQIKRGAFAGFVVGVAVPLMVVGIFTVSLRGYGIADSAPVPPQVYTAF